MTVVFRSWLRFFEPERSRFLTAPLSGACGKVYADERDEDYRAVFDLVRAAVEKAWESPRRDLVSLRPR